MFKISLIQKFLLMLQELSLHQFFLQNTYIQIYVIEHLKTHMLHKLSTHYVITKDPLLLLLKQVVEESLEVITHLYGHQKQSGQ
jgi:hypothetical protein